MRRVHWNILVLQECTHCKTVNCFSYSYTGSQKARLRVLSCWGSVWSLQAHGQNSERPSDTSTPGGIRERLQVTNISQGTGAIPPLPYPRDCWWQWGRHLDCPARTAVASVGWAPVLRTCHHPWAIRLLGLNWGRCLSGATLESFRRTPN